MGTETQREGKYEWIKLPENVSGRAYDQRQSCQNLD
jgi:hypothetical protein